MKVLLPYPHLSTSAKVLKPADVESQYDIAGDLYLLLEDFIPPDPMHPAAMWHGYEGALLYWWGCLASERPAGAMQSPAYVDAWCRAYRAGAMAVGPLPWWLGDTAFHLGCQSQLIASDVRYAGNFVHAPLDMAYLWPTEKVGEWTLSHS